MLAAYHVGSGSTTDRVVVGSVCLFVWLVIFDQSLRRRNIAVPVNHEMTAQ